MKTDRYICKPVSNRELERENKNITSLLETFYKQYLLDKKEIYKQYLLDKKEIYKLYL